MFTKEQLVQVLLRKRFPTADARYEIYKKSGALEEPRTLTEYPRMCPPTPSDVLEERRAHFEQIKEYESWLLSKTHDELQDELLKESTIELLCELTIAGYSVAANPERARAMAAMSVPGADGQVHAATSSADPAEILQQAEALKAELREKNTAEVRTIHDEAIAKKWRAGKHTLEEAAALIAGRIYPDDGYSWTVKDRSECESAYRAHLKSAVLSGRVPFFNPHKRERFDHERLSDERFPSDGLFAMESLYLALMDKHQGKGYLPLPRKPVSKAPAPIRPLDPKLPDLAYRFVFKSPDWEKWALMDRTQLWKAACLVAEIEPPKDSGKDLWQEAQLKTFPERFRRLWEVVNSDTLISQNEVQRMSGRMLHHVDIGWFAEWAVGKGLSMPEPMKERAERYRQEHERETVDIEKTKQTSQKEVPQAAEPAPIVTAAADQTKRSAETKNEDWREQAKQIADELFDRDTAVPCRDSLDGYAKRVMEAMQMRGIRGPRGIIDNHNTVKREALQGQKWWQRKKK